MFKTLRKSHQNSRQVGGTNDKTAAINHLCMAFDSGDEVFCRVHFCVSFGKERDCSRPHPREPPAPTQRPRVWPSGTLNLGIFIPKFGLWMICALNRLFVFRNQLLKDRFTSSLRRGSLPARRRRAIFQSATAAGVMAESGVASTCFRHAAKPPLR